MTMEGLDPRMSRSEWHYLEYRLFRDCIDEGQIYLSQHRRDELVDQMNIALRKFNFFQIMEARTEANGGPVEVEIPDFEDDYYGFID